MELDPKYYNEDGTYTLEGLMKFKSGISNGVSDTKTVDDGDDGVTIIKGGQNASDIQKQ